MLTLQSYIIDEDLLTFKSHIDWEFEPQAATTLLNKMFFSVILLVATTKSQFLGGLLWALKGEVNDIKGDFFLFCCLLAAVPPAPLKLRHYGALQIYYYYYYVW